MTFSQTLECCYPLFENVNFETMARKENKILEELRRRGGVFEDPAPKGSDDFIGVMMDPAPSIIGLLKRMFFKRK